MVFWFVLFFFPIICFLLNYCIIFFFLLFTSLFLILNHHCLILFLSDSPLYLKNNQYLLISDAWFKPERLHPRGKLINFYHSILLHTLFLFCFITIFILGINYNILTKFLIRKRLTIIYIRKISFRLSVCAFY